MRCRSDRTNMHSRTKPSSGLMLPPPPTVLEFYCVIHVGFGAIYRFWLSTALALFA
jgi:hypothetical protein